MPTCNAGEGWVLLIASSVRVLTTGAAQPAVGLFGAVQVSAVGGALPPLGSMDARLVLLELVVGVALMVKTLVPFTAMVPLKLQVTSVPLASGVPGVQLQPVPELLLYVMPDGNWSSTWALVAAAVADEELVTVRV